MPIAVVTRTRSGPIEDALGGADANVRDVALELVVVTVSMLQAPEAASEAEDDAASEQNGEEGVSHEECLSAAVVVMVVVMTKAEARTADDEVGEQSALPLVENVVYLAQRVTEARLEILERVATCAEPRSDGVVVELLATKQIGELGSRAARLRPSAA